MALPDISVVVYVNADPGGCVRLLTSLENTRPEKLNFEVILVIHGINKKVKALLNNYTFSFKLKMISVREKLTRAQGREKGVAITESAIILFLNTDLEASPELLTYHLEQYEKENTISVMGETYLPRFVKKNRWFRYLDSDYRSTRRWSRHSVKASSPPLRYVDTTNFSIRKWIYLLCNKNQTAFDSQEAENVDMAHRINALDRGEIRYHAEAIAFCQHPGLKKALKAKFDFGKTGIPRLIETYPDLYAKLPSRFVKTEGFQVVSPVTRLFMATLFTAPVFFIARGIRLIGPELIAFRMMRYMLQYESIRGFRSAIRDTGATHSSD